MTDVRLKIVENNGDAAQSEMLMKILLGKRRELTQALDKIDAEVIEVQAQLSKRIEEARIRRRTVEEALGHVDALLRIEGWKESDREAVNREPALRTNAETPADAAYDLLSALGKPLHYRLMALQLSENGIFLAGKDPAATLLSKMSRDDRFKRAPDRGVYGLATWRMRKSSGGKRKTKSKRSRKSNR